MRSEIRIAEVPHLNLPATVALPRMLIEQNGGSCAKARLSGGFGRLDPLPSGFEFNAGF